MINILHIIPTMNPESGGPAEGLHRLVLSLGVEGAVSTILTLDDPAAASWKFDASVSMVDLGPSKLSYAYSSKLIPWLQINVEKYDAVIVNGLWQYPGFAARQVCKAKGVPYYVFTHGMLDPWFKKEFPLKHLKKWLYWPWGQYPVLHDAAAVLFTCEEERVLARQSFWLYRCNEKVVGYGTVAPKGDAEQQREVFFEKYPETRGKRNLLFLSRIHEKKGCDLLIEAFADVAKLDGNLHLVMAGPDQQGWKKSLVQMSERLGVADRITWAGMVAGDVKWGAYHAADAFVLTSHQENFGIVVAEALACGLPTLISNKVNIWREIAEYEAGLVADDTLAGSKDLLGRWVGMSEEARNAMRRNAKHCFDTNFEMGQTAQNLIKVIVDL
jgi:glycosyltransferase involved in cell wall biosynthesis